MFRCHRYVCIKREHRKETWKLEVDYTEADATDAIKWLGHARHTKRVTPEQYPADFLLEIINEIEREWLIQKQQKEQESINNTCASNKIKPWEATPQIKEKNRIDNYTIIIVTRSRFQDHVELRLDEQSFSVLIKLGKADRPKWDPKRKIEWSDEVHVIDLHKPNSFEQIMKTMRLPTP